jgi:O-antigen/teichoic acid export membrane protein
MLFVISTGIIFLGKPAIILFYGNAYLLYGNAYLPSYKPLFYLLPGVFLFLVYKFLTVDLAARGHPGYGTIVSLVALIVNVTLNIVLIPMFGTVGAVIATSVSYIVMSLFSVYFFVSLTGHRVKEFLLSRWRNGDWSGKS